VEKVARIFRSFAEAGKADFEYYHSLTPEQRLDILGELIAFSQPDETEQRIKRVCRIIKLQED
jgi:ABC-type multidrug transport system ATPase subunit